MRSDPMEIDEDTFFDTQQTSKNACNAAAVGMADVDDDDDDYGGPPSFSDDDTSQIEAPECWNVGSIRLHCSSQKQSTPRN